ncbi:hypothetical protein, variant [Verruconis gallopava]|nr:hypothetical protein, variant [Verruconis gallopava]KIW08833.1 hypothetical protein, variant [Verruconis gallopava]
MSGAVVAFDSVASKVVDRRRDHAKYVVQVAAFERDDGRVWLATAGWDGKVLLYLAHVAAEGNFSFDAPIAIAPQPTNPEALYFVRRPDDNQLHLVVSRRDSSFLYYYEVSEPPLPTTTAEAAATSAAPTPATLQPVGRQNLAPHSNAWVAFTPAAIAPRPDDPTLVAVATTAVPHMKLIIARLLFPTGPEPARRLNADPADSAALSRASLLDDASGANETAVQQARAALALQDREAAAIAIHCTTMAAQTPYSTPTLAWRPDGSGVWVNGDDGVVRGIEAATGKVVSNLEGHEAGSKIRCLWAGYIAGTVTGVADAEKKECLLSGGFDQRLIAWR